MTIAAMPAKWNKRRIQATVTRTSVRWSRTHDLPLKETLQDWLQPFHRLQRYHRVWVLHVFGEWVGQNLRLWWRSCSQKADEVPPQKARLSVYQTYCTGRPNLRAISGHHVARSNYYTGVPWSQAKVSRGTRTYDRRDGVSEEGDSQPANAMTTTTVGFTIIMNPV